MRKVGIDIQNLVASLGGNTDEARINMRTREVLQRYRQAIESVYKDVAPIHLAHTNKVVITTKDEVKTLIVYVDDSLFAAELNAQRELIKLRLLELSGEDIEDFQIRTSRWKKYRETHPYLDENPEAAEKKAKAIPLDDQERAFVANMASKVEDKKIRESLEKAMKADMEWKKGEKVEK